MATGDDVAALHLRREAFREYLDELDAILGPVELGEVDAEIERIRRELD